MKTHQIRNLINYQSVKSETDLLMDLPRNIVRPHVIPAKAGIQLYQMVPAGLDSQMNRELRPVAIYPVLACGARVTTF